jgi:hypothetical protein
LRAQKKPRSSSSGSSLNKAARKAGASVKKTLLSVEALLIFVEASAKTAA